MTMKNFIRSVGIAAVFTAVTLSAAKPIPAGIIRLIEASQARPGNIPAWTNSNIDGVRARLDWPLVQPVETSHDWSDIDEMLKLGSQYGKLVGLSVC